MALRGGRIQPAFERGFPLFRNYYGTFNFRLINIRPISPLRFVT